MRDIYVISDLHLGGVYGAEGGGRGFRINTKVPVLTEFVRTVTTKAGAERELIVNGDMVDFLAEKSDGPVPWVPFTQDPSAAVKKLDNLCGRDAEFFAALADFLKAGHKLTVLLGNHDIELALPTVRARLAAILGVRTGSDYTLISNGEAIVRGDALIEHGNRYDMFNVVDYDSLRRVASLQSRRQPVPDKYTMTPPAGSLMVAQVINPIKEKYRFIDLLKPENGAVVPFLMTLEPTLRDVLMEAGAIALKAKESRIEASLLPSVTGELGEAALKRPGLLARVEAKILAAPAVLDRAVGMFELLTASHSPNISHRIHALQEALQDIRNDKTEDETVETEPEYLAAAETFAKSGFRYIAFGHTHARKRVPLSNGSLYFNSGCWVDLMTVPPGVFSSDHQVAATVMNEFIGAMETSALSSWIMYRPTFLRFRLDGEAMTAADLCDYTGPESV